MTIPTNGFLINSNFDSNISGTYLKAPSSFENTPLLNTIIDHSIYGGAINNCKKNSGISFNEQSNVSEAPITNVKNVANLMLPSTTLSSNVTPLVTKRHKSTTSDEETDNISENAGKNGAIDCIVYSQSDALASSNASYLFCLNLKKR